MARRLFGKVSACLLVALVLPATVYADEAEQGSLDDQYVKLSLEELLNLTTSSATRHEQDVLDAPSKVSVIGEAEMKLFGFRTLADVLRYASGFFMSKIPNGEVVPVVRGIGSENGIIVLLDGVPLLDAVTGQFYHYDMSLVGISKVEIMRGPGAALFGGNANTGLINLVSQKPDDSGNGVVATAGYPDRVGGQASVTAQTRRIGSFRLSVSAEYERGTQYHVPSDGSVTLLTNTPSSLTDPNNLFYVAQRAEPTTKATSLLRWDGPRGLALTSFASFRRLSPLLDPSYGGSRGPAPVTIEGDFQRRDLLLMNDLSWKSKPWSGGSLRASFRYVLNLRDQDGFISPPIDGAAAANGVPLRGVYESYAYGQHRLGPELQLDAKLPLNNLLTVGILGNLDVVDRESYRTNFVFASGATETRAAFASIAERPDYFLPPNLKRWSAGAYVQDVFSPWRWLDLVAGVRFDAFSDRGIISETQVARDEQCRNSPFGCQPKGYKDIADNGRNYVQWSPRVAAVSKLDRGQWHGRLKLMFGQAFTPPPLLSLSNQTSIDRGTGVFGNPLLAPTISRTLEGGFILARGKRLIRASYFYVKTKDEVVFNPDNGSYANIANRTVHGFDAEANGTETLWTRNTEIYYRAGASYQRMLADGSPLLGIGADIYPRTLANLLLGVRWRHKVSLGLGNVFVSQARRENVDVRPGLPARYLLDAALSVNDVWHEGLGLQLIAQNIVGTRYADPLSGYLGVREDYPRGGRQILLSIGWFGARSTTSPAPGGW